MFVAVLGQLVTPRRRLQVLEPEAGRLTLIPPSPVVFKYKNLIIVRWVNNLGLVALNTVLLRLLFLAVAARARGPKSRCS